MKKILCAIAFLVCIIGYGQINVTNVEGIAFDGQTTATLNGLGTKVLGDLYLDSTLGYHVWWNGTAFVSLAGSGGSAAWGSITGTLSNQTDLQNALNAKLSLSGGTMTGNITFNGTEQITNLLRVTSEELQAGGAGVASDLTGWKLYPEGSTFDVNANLRIRSEQSGGAYLTDYTLRWGGVPIQSTDLINKGYADANYSGGVAPWTVVGDGSTDFTTAVNTALTTYGTVEIVNEVIVSSAITLNQGNMIYGSGQITNNTTDVFAINASDVIIKDIRVSTNAGNIITFSGSSFGLNLINTRLQQLNTAKSHFYLRGTTGVYGSRIQGNYLETGPGHTVPMIDVLVSQENFNHNVFSDNTYQSNTGPTAPAVRFETTAAANWLYGNKLINELFEVPTAGAIHAFSNAGLQIINCAVYDVNFDTNSTDDYIVIDNTSGGLNSKGTLISGYQRVSSPLGTGFHDIDNRGHYAGGITIIHPIGAPAGQLEFNNLSTHFLLGGSDISDNGGATVIDGGGGSIGGSISNNQIAVGAATANNIEGNANATYDGSKLQISSGYLESDQGFKLGSDLGIKPVVNHQSSMAAYWGIQLNGNTQVNPAFDYVPAGIGTNNAFDVIVNGAASAEPTADRLLVRNHPTGTGALIRATNSSLTDQFAVDANGNITTVGTINAPISALSNVGTAGAGMGEVLIGNGATYNSNALTAALVTYNNSTSGLTATIVQDGIDENAANNTLLDGRVTILETTAGDHGSRITTIEDALANPSSSVRVNEIKTAPYTFVIADAEDRKQIIFDYNDEGATLNAGIFPTGTILNVLGHPSSAGEVRLLEGTDVSFVGYSDGAIITPGVPFTLERIGTATAPETWFVLGPSLDVSDYSGLGPELLTNGDDFSSGWGYQNGSSASGGVATAIGAGNPTSTAANHVVYQDITALTASTSYRITITWRRTVGSGSAYVSEKFANLQTNASLSGSFVTQSFDFTAAGQDRIVIGADSGTTLEIDSISLREIL